MSFFLLLNTKEYILKNKGDGTTMEVNGVHHLSGSQHSSKYFLLSSTEERNSYRFETT